RRDRGEGGRGRKGGNHTQLRDKGGSNSGVVPNIKEGKGVGEKRGGGEKRERGGRGGERKGEGERGKRGKERGGKGKKCGGRENLL
ncbi:hypothetical protein, partial [Streptococcus pyogenes]|uniref:hypothetical protein n=1 Tax=Streptococcus pyogenes TaxID=1314 RepID=UPI00387DC4B9